MFEQAVEEKAKIVAIKESFSGNPTMNMSRNVPLALGTTEHSITFEKGDGTLMIFKVSESKIENLRTGLTGIVKYRGRKFIEFKRES